MLFRASWKPGRTWSDTQHAAGTRPHPPRPGGCRAEAEGPGGGGRRPPTASAAPAASAVLQTPAIAQKRPQRAVRKDASCGWGRTHLPGSSFQHLGENLFLRHPRVGAEAPRELPASSKGSAAGFEVFTKV